MDGKSEITERYSNLYVDNIQKNRRGVIGFY